MKQFIVIFVLLFATVPSSALSNQAKSGPTGLYISGDRTGSLFNPTMSRVYVQKVDKDSCAERSGFMAGDEIVSINDRIVAGQKAKELMSFWKSLDRSGGVRFVIKRSDNNQRLLLCGPSTR